jgi:hypothetical protein
MTSGIWVLALVLAGGMLLRMPIGFSMLISGFAYLMVKRQDLGLVAEQVGNGLYNSYVLLAVPLLLPVGVCVLLPVGVPLGLWLRRWLGRRPRLEGLARPQGREELDLANRP